ncbi:MAG: MBL fold metallo-hydrolase [Bradymonadales bacterium]|nr:MBL fold metallo-hydrolase [Bradymonadales bacterium]
MTLQFLGAAGTVTGSKFLLNAGGETLMVDCGLFQGLKELRLKNWEELPIDPSGIDHVVLTHAHIDHSGYLPRLVRDGYRRRIWGTSGTNDLLHILLPDAGYLQEEEADYANRKGYSKHSPALPLFTQQDAEMVLRYLGTLPYMTPTTLSSTYTVEFRPAGHILGSSILMVEVSDGGERKVRIAFSGDLGRYDAPILKDPAEVWDADFLVVESTYGDRSHASGEDSRTQLAQIVNETQEAGGVLLVPAFAVGRTQTLLYLLRELEDAKLIEKLPVFVDSPMAIKASGYLKAHPEDFDEETLRLQALRKKPLTPDRTRFCASQRESKDINRVERDAIIISASGMLTGGRILHHASIRLPDPKNTLLLVGYQAAGTRGRRILEGEREIKIHGAMVPINARLAELHGLSAHADADEIIRWAGGMTRPPQKAFVVHGEPKPARTLSGRLETELGWSTHIARLGEEVTLVEG